MAPESTMLLTTLPTISDGGHKITSTDWPSVKGGDKHPITSKEFRPSWRMFQPSSQGQIQKFETSSVPQPSLPLVIIRSIILYYGKFVPDWNTLLPSPIDQRILISLSKKKSSRLARSGGCQVVKLSIHERQAKRSFLERVKV